MSFRFTKHPFFKVYEILFLFLIPVAFGTAGYMYIEQFTFIEALYMTVITIGTVGFEEVHPLSTNGMIFTIVLIIATFITVSLFLAYITRYFLDGHFRQTYKLFKMKQKISRLSNHVILCGFGRNGRSAANLLLINKIPVVVIEKSLEQIELDSSQLEYYLVADATMDESLIDGGIMQAQAIIVTLPNDADNVFIVLTAKALNPLIRIISRASNDTSVNKMKTAGATNVIMPDKIGGTHMATLVVNSDVKEFLDYLSTQSNENFQVAEILVNKKLTLADADLWKATGGATILGLKNSVDEYQMNPPPDTVLRDGDRIIVMGSHKQLANIKNMVS
jgi:voltage-gated potassium channel